MPDLNIPGVTESKFKTDTIISGLVKTKEVQLNRMEGDRDNFELKRKVWQSVNLLTQKLEDGAHSLYNIDSPFRQKFSTSSNERVLTVSNHSRAENGEYIVRVLQIAEADSLRSDEIANDYQVPAGNYTFGSGEDTKSFDFNGGTLKKFVSIANRQLQGIARFSLINSRGQKQVVVFHSAKSGAENRVRFDGEGKRLAIDIGLILDADSLRLNLLREVLISPFNELSDYKFSESKNEVSIGAGQELRISLPNSYSIRSGSVMRYEVQAPQDNVPPPISNTPDNLTNRENNADLSGKSRSRLNSRDAVEIPPPPSAELDNIRIDSAGSDTAFIGVEVEIGAKEEGRNPTPQPPPSNSAPAAILPSGDLLNPTTHFYFVQDGRRIPAGPKEGEIQASMFAHEEILSLDSIPQLRHINEVIIRNPNPDRSIVVRDLRFENIEMKEDYLAAHPISRAQDAKISYLGVETQRPGNNVNDLLPGLTLNLKRAEPEEDIIIRTEPDYDAIIQKTAEFVSAYNDLLTQLNVISSSNMSIIDEKTSFTDKQKEEAKEVLGLMRGDSNVSNFRYRLIRGISEGYPTDMGTHVISDIGISTNLSGSRQVGVDQSKLRGYLEFDTEIFRQAMLDNFRMVKDLFGRDNDGDFAVDSGVAWEIQRIGNAYTQPNGSIPYRVKDLDRRIEDSDRRIADYKDYLKKYESDLKVKYGAMEGALNQLERQSESLKNFSDSMNR
ncbi:MAG: flagellar filament capping protein FliD [Spirochaetota bacterium]